MEPYVLQNDLFQTCDIHDLYGTLQLISLYNPASTNGLGSHPENGTPKTEKDLKLNSFRIIFLFDEFIPLNTSLSVEMHEGWIFI